MWHTLLIGMVFITILVFLSKRTMTETFTSSSQQTYLNFLDTLLQEYKHLAPTTGPFMGSCDDKVNEKAQMQALYNVFKHSSTTKTDTKQHCASIASKLCSFTNPSFHMAEKVDTPPRWLLPSLKDTPLPQHTNMSCFNTNFDCCVSAFRKHKTEI
jgi:hypothetical protein